jgi:Family of unknown function (DUF5719)
VISSLTFRRAAGALVAVASFVGIFAVARTAEPRITPVFASLLPPTMPFVPAGESIETTWFCPGMPSGSDGTAGAVHLVNASTEARTARLTVFGEGLAAVDRSVSMAPGGDTVVSLSDAQPAAPFVSALVEIDGSGVFVEQQAEDPAGAAVAACSNSTSSEWYLPEGFTSESSTETLVISNPFPSPAQVDISFVTNAAPRRPGPLQAFVVPAEGIATVDLDEYALNEPVVATAIEATRGRVVVGRAQHFTGGGRRGFTMSLGVPALTDQLYFADGESAPGVTERYTIYNGGEDEVTVSAVFLGVPLSEAFANDTSLDVPGGEAVTFDTSTVANLPAGRHGLVFSTLGVPSIAVERAITRTVDGTPVTTVVAGSPPNFAVTRWSMAIGPTQAVDDTLVVLNADAADATVSVRAVGPGGETPVAGMEALALPATGVATFTVPAEAIDRPLIVESTQRVFVERLLPRGDDLRGRSGSFALAG